MRLCMSVPLPSRSGGGRRVGVAWMSDVFGRDDGPLAAAFDECPSFRGLEVVMVGAEPVEKLEDGRMGVSPVLAVVVLQVGEVATSLDGTGRVQPLERSAGGRWDAGQGGQLRRPPHLS